MKQPETSMCKSPSLSPAGPQESGTELSPKVSDDFTEGLDPTHSTTRAIPSATAVAQAFVLCLRHGGWEETSRMSRKSQNPLYYCETAMNCTQCYLPSQKIISEIALLLAVNRRIDCLTISCNICMLFVCYCFLRILLFSSVV